MRPGPRSCPRGRARGSGPPPRATLTAFTALTALAGLTATGAIASSRAYARRARQHLPSAHVDRAAACQRRGDWACALSESDAALAGLGAAAQEPQAGTPPVSAGDIRRRLERHALIVRAEALARLGQAAEAARAYRRVLRAWPGWSPPPDAPPSVRQAFRDGRLQDLRARLPGRLPLPPPPTPPPATPADLAPPPLLYAPKHLVELDPEAARVERWRLAMGGGIALLTGRAREIFAHGAAASIELGVLVSRRWRVLARADLSLHNFASSFRPEPGYGRGLTTAAVTAGAMVDIPLLRDLEAFAALTAGGGMFGVRSVAERSGVALCGLAGARYWITPTLAVRLEGGVRATFPLAGEAGQLPRAAAHGELGLRMEARF